MDPSSTAPPSYHRLDHAARRVFVRDDAGEVVAAVGFADGEGRHADGTSIGGGRSAHATHTLPDGSRWIWKRCRRGGLAAHLLGDRYLRTARFLRELHLHEQARAAGIPVSDLVALALTSTSLGTHRVEQLIRFEEGATDLAQVLFAEASRESTIEPTRRSAVIDAVGRAVGRFHAAGLLHGDLNLRNVLVRGATGASDPTADDVILIDLDPAPPSRVRAHSPEGNVLRFFRSWGRVCGGHDAGATGTEVETFLTGYAAGAETGLAARVRDAVLASSDRPASAVGKEVPQ